MAAFLLIDGPARLFLSDLRTFVRSPRFWLHAGAVWLLASSAAHMSGFKAPGLFFYFDIPSYPYQDKVISVLLFAMSMFFLFAADTVEERPVALIYVLSALVAALVGFSAINLSHEFRGLGPRTAAYWAAVAVSAVYTAWLAFLYFDSKRSK